ncbi:MAG: hypothetical protein EA351_02535 [Gemmatimonadales bacterium]|nr:MAG: hypothetical protein EA351_02535 [Gemmatimonadales bacterium]
MEADRFQELCEEFLLSGLEGEELRAFREELDRRGAEGGRILDRTMESMGLLALSAPPVDPPPALRERLMAEVSAGTESQGESVDGSGAGSTPARPILVEDTPAESASPGAPRPDSSHPGTEPRPSAEPARPGRPGSPADAPYPWVRSVLLAAAIVAAVVLGAWNVNLQSDLSERTAALEEAQQELEAVDTLREELATLREDLGTIVSPTGSVISLAGTETRPDARARVFVDPQTGRALILAFDLPILTAESIYQLWAIRDGEPFSVGTFTATAEGPARLELDSLDPVAGADLLAVTIEPAPGQPAPTGEMVLISGQ